MGRSFDSVDWKVAESEFSPRRIPECGSEFFEVRCYVNAFVSSARSVTFALQSCLHDAPGFHQWHRARQEALQQDDLAKFFNDFRRVDQHIGDNLVGAGECRGVNRRTRCFFLPTPEIREVPSEDVESACRRSWLD